MACFDQSGNLLGISGNYQPAIATADGGLIATTSGDTTVTFDANLNITGTLATFLLVDLRFANVNFAQDDRIE